MLIHRDIENRLVVAKGEWEIGVSRGKLLYIEWKSNKVLLHSTKYIQYPMLTIMKNNIKKLDISITDHFVV